MPLTSTMVKLKMKSKTKLRVKAIKSIERNRRGFSLVYFVSRDCSHNVLENDYYISFKSESTSNFNCAVAYFLAGGDSRR